jgi:hypothetical protein
MTELNDKDPYDVVAQSIDERLWESQPWNMGTWHPDGAHFWHCQLPLNIVVTDWTDDGVYDVNVYTDAQMDQMDTALQYNHVPIESAGALVLGLTVGGEAERLYRTQRPMTEKPWPPERALAEYLEIVRTGISTVHNVAGAAGGDYGAVTDWDLHRAEIASEIDECSPTDIDRDLALTLAEAAIDICRADLGLTTRTW